MAKIVPKRAGSTPTSPAWSNASAAAAMANCSTRSARRASFGESYHGVGSQSAISIDRPDVMPGPSRPVPERVRADAARGDDAEPGDGDPAARRPSIRPSELAGDQVVRLADGLDPSSSSSGTEMSNSSSSAITSSTRSRLSASRSSPNRASGDDLVLGDGQHLDGALLETAEQFLIHGELLGRVVDGVDVRAMALGRVWHTVRSVSAPCRGRRRRG